MKYQIEGNVLQAVAQYLNSRVEYQQVAQLLKALESATPVVEEDPVVPSEEASE